MKDLKLKAFQKLKTISRTNIAAERETDSLNDLFKEEVMANISIDIFLCQVMAKQTKGEKSKNWIEMEERFKIIQTYIDKIHLKAKREYLMNDMKPSGIITLLDENKRLKRLNSSLMQQNDKLKTQIDNYVSRYGI